MVRIGPMASPKFPLNRRELMVGFAAMGVTSALLPVAPARGWQTRVLPTKAGTIALRPGAPETPIWSLAGSSLAFTKADSPQVEFSCDLPVPTVLNWRGVDGAPTIEPLLARRPLTVGSDNFQLLVRHAGTFLCDLSLLGDGQARPLRGLALIVGEREPVAVDRDQVLLIEDWRLRPDGTAIAPGVDPKDTSPVFTVNGLTSLELTARSNERIRFRFINACQRSAFAIKLENIDVRVMALDGEPAEPFQARNGALVLAPGGRVDAFVDVTAPAGTTSSILLHDGKAAHQIGKLVISREPPIRPAPLQPAPPLPSNGLPTQLDLKNALRFELDLGGAQADWSPPAKFAASAAPAFRAKTGRTVVLALTNRASIATVFHLHGHHFRLLDRLDDGWKPFWLDTLAIEPGQTQRIAFLAEYPGRYLIESVATDWAAPRLVRWYSVA